MAEEGDVSVDTGVYRDALKEYSGWIAFGLFLVCIIAFAALEVLTALVFGLFLYYGTRPIFRRLKKIGAGEELAAVVSLLAVGLPVLIVSVLIVFSAFNQASDLVQQGTLQQFEPILQNVELYNELKNAPSSSLTDFIRSQGFLSVLTSYWGSISGVANRAVGVLFSVFIAFVSAFFMFLWGPRFMQDVERVFGGESGVLRRFLDRLDTDLSTVFFGNMVNAVVTSMIGALVYTGMNAFYTGAVAVPVPVLLGLLTGIASFVPLVGSKIAYVPAAGIMVFQAYTLGEPAGYGFTMLFLLLAFVIVDTLPDMVLRPLFSGKSTSQGALFLSYLVGPVVFGFVGLFLLPIIVVSFINFYRIVLPGFMRDD